MHIDRPPCLPLPPLPTNLFSCKESHAEALPLGSLDERFCPQVAALLLVPYSSTQPLNSSVRLDSLLQSGKAPRRDGGAEGSGPKCSLGSLHGRPQEP